MYPTTQAPGSGAFIEQQVLGLREVGLDVDVMFLDRTRKGMDVYRGLPKRVRSEAERLKPSIVHVMYGGVMADLVTSALTDKPTVVTFHGSDLLGEHLSGLLRKAFAGWGVLASWRAARRASGIVVVSKRLRAALPRGIDRSKVRIIPCGIDLAGFAPRSPVESRQRLGWEEGLFNVLFNGNSTDAVKRPWLARDAVAVLNGMGVRAVLRELRGVPNDVVPLWLSASDVLLLTSRHEGSPTIVKEALACNLPVVSVDVGDVQERIREIAGCYIAAPRPDDLAAKMAAVRAGPPRILGRQHALELSTERIARRLVAFYREVANAPA